MTGPIKIDGKLSLLPLGIAVIAGAIAWGTLSEKVSTVSNAQAALQKDVADLRMLTATLARIDERTLRMDKSLDDLTRAVRTMEK